MNDTHETLGDLIEALHNENVANKRSVGFLKWLKAKDEAEVLRMWKVYQNELREGLYEDN